VSGAVTADLFTGVTFGAPGLTGTIVTGTTLSVSFDLTVQAHNASGGVSTPNMVTFNLANGDVIAGLSGAGASGDVAGKTAGSTGVTNVFVDGVYAASGSFSIVGSKITFTGSAVPPSGTVTYTYSQGMASGVRSQDTTIAVSGATAGLQVFISGSSTAATLGTDYKISGGSLILLGNTNTGTSVTFGLAAGSTGTTGTVSVDKSAAVSITGQIGSSKTTYQTVFTTSDTLLSGQSIVNVAVGGVALTTGTEYTVTGNDITLASGVGSGVSITYQVQAFSGLTAGSWSTDAGIDASVSGLDAALGILRTQSAALASNLNVVATRQDFTDGMVNTLLKGADNLTLADMNEEGANMLMLQTRQQLSTTSLKMASDAAQAVLRLF
jgi:flagellin-like hook-associated protein FlgL